MVPLARTVSLFVALLIIGTGLTAPLFKFDWIRFVHSSLFTKILLWIPIFIIFLFVLYMHNPARLGVLAIILVIASWEFLKAAKRHHKWQLYLFYSFFVIGMAHFCFIATEPSVNFVSILITLCFATVLSDVTAFFMGNYLGKHKLPKTINSKKSWEGVAGEVLGALIGVLLVNHFILRVPSLWLFLPIGIGCVLGDLANSYAKRLANIKDWGNSIPGHGGFLDRFASFAGSVLLTVYFLKFL